MAAHANVENMQHYTSECVYNLLFTPEIVINQLYSSMAASLRHARVIMASA